MIDYHGKSVFSSRAEVLAPAHTALVVIDDGDRLPAGEPAVVQLARTVRAARRAGALVVWAPASERLQLSTIGDWAVPVADEPVVVRYGASGFVGTALALLLRRADIATIVTAGNSTDYGVQSTAEGAGHRDFYSVVAQDCTWSADAGLHNDALSILRMRCEITDSTELLGEWSPAAR